MIHFLIIYFQLWLPRPFESRSQRASRLCAALAPVLAGVGVLVWVWP